MTHITIQFICDVCKYNMETLAYSQSSMVDAHAKLTENAVRSGWAIRGSNGGPDRHLCPMCRHSKKRSVYDKKANKQRTILRGV